MNGNSFIAMKLENVLKSKNENDVILKFLAAQLRKCVSEILIAMPNKIIVQRYLAAAQYI